MVGMDCMPLLFGTFRSGRKAHAPSFMLDVTSSHERVEGVRLKPKAVVCSNVWEGLFRQVRHVNENTTTRREAARLRAAHVTRHDSSAIILKKKTSELLICCVLQSLNKRLQFSTLTAARRS